MPNDWNPRLRCAHAVDRNRFAMVYGELEYDDPFSIMLFYDGAFEQPWRRVDVQREINAVIAFDDGAMSVGGGRYALLSNEGDVYFSDPDFPTEKIPGAGIQSPGAPGRGALNALAAYSDTLFAAGARGQIYRRGADGTWTDWTKGKNGGDAVSQVAIASIHAVGTDALLAVGGILPEAQAYDITEDPNFSDTMSVEELTALFERQATLEGPALEAVGKAFRVGTDAVLQLVRAQIPNLRALHVEAADSIWIVGSNGTILHGGLQRPFEVISFKGDEQTLFSVTRFRGEIILASDYALHRFDGHFLKPLRPRLKETVNGGVPTPLKVQAVDDVMFYFDYKHGVYRWDRNNWEAIPIPPALLEREFGSLR